MKFYDCILQSLKQYFFKKEARRVCSIYWVSHCLASLGKFTPGCWKGSCSQLSYLGFKQKKGDSVLVWSSFLILWSSWERHVSLPNQSTCVGPLGSTVGCIESILRGKVSGSGTSNLHCCRWHGFVGFFSLWPPSGTGGVWSRVGGLAASYKRTSTDSDSPLLSAHLWPSLDPNRLGSGLV